MAGAGLHQVGERGKGDFRMKNEVRPIASEPLTLEQLREMELPTPVWAELKEKTIEGWDGYWCLCCRGKILTPGLVSISAEKVDGIDFYAYPPAHIDREAWGCEYCTGHVDDRPFLDSEDLYISGNGWLTSDGQDHDFCKIDFCPKCGRPLTEEAWAELEKRMGDYIDRRKAAEVLCKAICGSDRGLCVSTPENCQQKKMLALYELPAADVARVVHAEWVQVICHVEFEDGFVDRVYECCSDCHMPNGRTQTDFCPNCGAKMDGERSTD